jgi:Tol biopolymer transport system component
VRLAVNFKDARYGVWSPDGKYILFTGCLNPTQNLANCWEWWVTSRDGKRVENTGALHILHSQQIDLPVDAVGGWYGESGTVLFSGISNDMNSLWELDLPFRNLRAAVRAKQLTSGEIRAVTPSINENGTLAYGQMVGALHVWRIEDALSSDPVTIRVTDGPNVDHVPYICQKQQLSWSY